MKDLYLGHLTEGEVYEYFDGRMCYIIKTHDHVVAVYETYRGRDQPWTFNLRTVNYLRRNIRTILEVF